MSVRFCLIGATNKKYHGKRLEEEIIKRGHSVDFVLSSSLDMIVDSEEYIVRSGKKNLHDYDIYIKRGASATFRYAFAKEIEDPNKVVFETTFKGDSIDKFDEYILLSHADSNIHIPKSTMIGVADKVKEHVLRRRIQHAIDAIGLPAILKLLPGSKGNMVFQVQTNDDIYKIMLSNPLKRTLLQEKIGNKEDIRILVLGDQVLGAMKKTATGDEFRTNVAQGGTTEAFFLSSEMKELAVKIAKKVGIEFAGIDLMPHNGSYYVLEVNDAPQFEGFEKATGVNVASALIDYLLQKLETQRASA